MDEEKYFWGNPLNLLCVTKEVYDLLSAYENLKDDIYKLVKDSDCDVCKKVKEMTYPTVYG